ncbi:phage tail protein [Escherichia coli]|nr:phage tail protein [Escherichia coli]EGE1547941.1 phage tail protein [Escherichia coli]HAK9821537.1 phage tail protein [Escherichia coli]HAM9435747.1 phage tail protein [Escherichia coli]HAM9630669.1 phage tail protein [Escherichia coli]
MQDIRQETHHETTRLTQSAQVVLWEIDLTEVGGERYFFCNVAIRDHYRQGL